MIDPTKFDSEVEQHDPTKKQKTGNTDELKKQLLTAVIVLVTNILFTATVYAQPTVWGSASPSVIEANTQLVTLSWGSSNADYCEANGGSFPTSGSIPSGPFPAGSHSQSFSCTGPGGTSHYTIYWTAVNPPPVPVLSSFGISPSVAYTTQPLTVSWSASDADSCSASSGHTFSGSGSTVFPAGTLPTGYHSFSMQCSGPGGTSNTLYASVTIQDPPPPIPTTPTGLTSSSFAPETGSSYTVSWAASSGATSYQLTQNGTPQSLSVTSQTFNPGSAGTYNYTVSACNASGCSAASTAIGVVVTDPLPTPVAITGFDANYEAFWSSSPSDNSLYFLRDNSDGNYEGVTDFILEEQLDGSYSLNANPTSAQISQFNLYTPTSVGYELADINLDGAIDMVLMSATNTAAGIVYAATASQSAPVAYKHIDEEFVEFFEDLYPGLDDPSYYVSTALSNNWGSWHYGAPREGWHDTDMLFLSGQLFMGISPFYTNLSQAYDPSRPHWCDNPYPQSSGYYNPIFGVWQVYGIYQDSVFEPDYTQWNQSALEVAAPLMHYLNYETSAGIPPIVFAILEDILGVNHGLDNEPAIFNLVKLMGQILFGFGVEQETKRPKILAKVELLYTDIGLPALPPFARHAYLQVTFPNGNIYVTRGGPQEEPAFWPFGYIETQKADNTVVPITTADLKDIQSPILFRQLVGHTALSEIFVNMQMTNASINVNTCDIPYLLITNNSNSYAFQTVSIVSGLPRPIAAVWAPGASASIPCP